MGSEIASSLERHAFYTSAVDEQYIGPFCHALGLTRDHIYDPTLT